MYVPSTLVVAEDFDFGPPFDNDFNILGVSNHLNSPLIFGVNEITLILEKDDKNSKNDKKVQTKMWKTISTSAILLSAIVFLSSSTLKHMSRNQYRKESRQGEKEIPFLFSFTFDPILTTTKG